MISNIYEHTLIHWTKLIEPFFPKNTRFMTVDTENTFCIYIQPPEDDERRSQTLYRKIIFAFTDEAINEYIYYYERGSHRKAEIRLKEFVAAKLKNHKPDHDTFQKNHLPEYWLITTDILNR
jgi:hypothetical protein